MESQNKYEVFDNLIEGVQVIDRKWRYIYVNNVVAKQGKATGEELLGYTMMEKYPGIENTPLFKNLERCINEHLSSRITNEFHFPDGSKGWFDLSISPIEEGILILSFDITRQKLLEIELRQLNEQLESKIKERTEDLIASLNREKELNELKSKFVSMASHEFRTPLSSVLLSANLVESYGAKGEFEKQKKHIERIKSSIKDLVNIVNDFLSLDKLESDKVYVESEYFNLYEYFKHIIEDIESIRKPGQIINYMYNGSSEVQIDKKIVHNIMLNLLSNAIKYSEDNIELKVAAENREIKILVIDKGIGIPEDERDNIFSKFFRASNATHINGTGLGLNIVKRYVELLGGTIAYTSIHNQGTTFAVNLPNNQY